MPYTPKKNKLQLFFGSYVIFLPSNTEQESETESPQQVL